MADEKSSTGNTKTPEFEPPQGEYCHDLANTAVETSDESAWRKSGHHQLITDLIILINLRISSTILLQSKFTLTHNDLFSFHSNLILKSEYFLLSSCLACVSRIIKNVLPENVQITKDARAAFTRAAGIFIFYLVRS